MPQLMDRNHFQSLPLPMRETWTERLKDQWNVELDQTVEFWFDGDQITSVAVYKLNEEGKKYAVGHDVATELLGAAV